MIEEIIRNIVVKELAPFRAQLAGLAAEQQCITSAVKSSSREDVVTAALNKLRSDMEHRIREETKTAEITNLTRRLQQNLDEVGKIVNAQFITKEEWKATLDVLYVEVKQKIEDLILTDSRVVDHGKVSVQALEGLKGGGTIDRNVPLAIDIEHLETMPPRPGSCFLFSDTVEASLFRITFDALVTAMLNTHHVLERLNTLEKL